jgi:uncharacterized protein (TIGR02466 family)
MINHIFPNYFYGHFSSNDNEKLLKCICELKEHQNQNFGWGYKCISEKIRLEPNDEIVSLLYPFIYNFIEKFQIDLDLNIILYDIWKNIYNEGYFQEIHDHIDGVCNLSCVIFLNNWEEGDATFYFQNRNLSEIDKFWKKIVNSSTHYIKPKKGDIILFPSNMLHGVSPHRSKRIRETISINFSIS